MTCPLQRIGGWWLFVLLWWTPSFGRRLVATASPIEQDFVSNNVFGDRDRVVITTNMGNEYVVHTETLEPLVGLFDPTQYRVSALQVQNKNTHKSLPITVFRTKQEGGVMQVHMQDGVIYLLEIHPKDAPVVFVVRQQSGTSSYYQEYSENDLALPLEIDGAPVLPSQQPGDDNRLIRSPRRHRNGSGQALRGRALTTKHRRAATRKAFEFNVDEDCADLTLIHIAIAYDEEFCELYGSKSRAEEHIQAIVAGASLYYEEDMCAQLVLVAILAPRTCDASSSTFLQDEDTDRDNACNKATPDDGTKSYLLGFTQQMRRERIALGLPDHAAIHLFTGFSFRGRAELGCTYSRAYCDVLWSYGISYMSFSPDNIAPQIIVAAHEIAHTLGVPHYKGEEGLDYIMRPYVTSGNQGFSKSSVNDLYTYLDKVSCHEVVPAKRTITATIVFPNNIIYIFYTQANVGLYTKYDWDAGEVESGYPRQVVGNWGDSWPNSDWWPTGGFVHGDIAYFLKSSRDQGGGTRGSTTVLAYDMNEYDVDPPYPQDVDWDGLPSGAYYRAAVLFPGNNLYLFSGDEYYKLDLSTNKAASGYPRKIADNWGNWPANFEVTSGFVTPSGEYAYFFGFDTDNESENEWDGEPVYVKYNVEEDEVEVGYPRSIVNNWVGILD